MDRISASRRSENMRRIRSRDTAPEILIRRLVYALGYRFRLHREDLPGKPDLTFPRLRKVIFVHGCFWHQHDGCVESRIPKSNRSYWVPKLARNKKRDEENRRALRRLGWRSLIIWECQVSKPEQLTQRICRFLI